MRCAEQSRWRSFIEARDTVREILAPALRLNHLLARGRQIAHALGERPRAKRPRQLQKLADLTAHL